MTKSIWNDVLIVERLRDLIARGLNFAQIAHDLGCTRNAAIGKAHRLGIVTAPHKVGSTKPKIKLPHPPVLRLEPKPFPRPAPVLAGEITFLNLEPNHCRYLFDDGLFCGKPKAIKSYCAYHASRCYLPSDR